MLRGLGLTSVNLVGCVFHSLLVLRTSVLAGQEEYRPVLRDLLDPRTAGLGIQIRTMVVDDSASSSGQLMQPPSVSALLNGSYAEYFHCAHDVTDHWLFNSTDTASDATGSTTKVLWFLLSDSQTVRSAASDRWGVHRARTNSGFYLRTLMLPALLGHVALADSPGLTSAIFHHALVEQFLYSLCQRHILSHFSGFARIPLMLGMRATHAYELSPEEQRPGYLSCLSERQAASLEAVAASYSQV